MDTRFYYNPLMGHNEDGSFYIDIYVEYGNKSKCIGRIEDTSCISLMKRVKTVVWYLNKFHPNCISVKDTFAAYAWKYFGYAKPLLKSFSEKI